MGELNESDVDWLPTRTSVIAASLGIGWITGGIECWLIAADSQLYWSVNDVALAVLLVVFAGGLIAGLFAIPALAIFAYSRAELATDRCAQALGAVAFMCSMWLNTELVLQLWEDGRKAPAAMVAMSNFLFAAMVWQNARYWYRRRLVHGRGRIRWWWFSLLVAVVLASTGGWSMLNQSYGGDQAVASEPDVTVIVVDGLRYDALQGESRAHTPNIDAFAETSIRYHQAISPAPVTLPAQIGLMYGIYPSQVGLIDNHGPVFAGLPSLMKSLEDQGYARASFWSSPVFAGQPELPRAFEVYDSDSPPLRGLLQLLLLKRLKHWLDLSGRSSAATLYQAQQWVERESTVPSLSWVQLELSSAQSREQYNEHVNQLDRELGSILTALETRQSIRPQVIVLTAGRGMMLGEHKFWGLSEGLYEANIHVPLLIRAIRAVPSNGQRDVQQSVRTLDVMNTVLWQLELSNINTSQSADIVQYLERSDFSGYQAMLVGADAKDFEAGHAYGLRISSGDQQIKYLYFPGRQRRAYYDLNQDPDEHEDLSELEENKRRQIEQRLLSILEKLPSQTQPKKPTEALASEGFVSW